MTYLSDDGSWPQSPAGSGVATPAKMNAQHARLRPVAPHRRTVSMTSRPLILRLNATGLQVGRLISTQQGSACCLWVVESVTDGAGDGCVEVTLRLQP